MVSLVMVMFDELVDELAHMSLAKRNHATETLLFDRADEPLGIDKALRLGLFGGGESPAGVILQ